MEWEKQRSGWTVLANTGYLSTCLGDSARKTIGKGTSSTRAEQETQEKAASAAEVCFWKQNLPRVSGTLCRFGAAWAKGFLPLRRQRSSSVAIAMRARSLAPPEERLRSG